MKHSSRDFSPRSLLAVIVALPLTILVLHYSNRFYYKPVCQRYADAERLTYNSFHMPWVRHDMPAECFFRDRRGNLSRVDVADIPKEPSDWLRWVLSWVATVLGVGGSVWLGSVVGGFKLGKRRRQRRSKDRDRD